MMLCDAIEHFYEMLDNPNATLDDLMQIVDSLSVKDNIASDNATTHLYTIVGNNKEFINDNVRVLDHTEAFEFLEGLDEEIKAFVKNVIKKNNPNYTGQEVEKFANAFFYGNFEDKNNITKGLWGVISEKFAKETKGDVICHVGDVDEATTRIWWNVEMPQILAADSEVTTVNGVLAEELRKTYNELGGVNNLEALNEINSIVAEKSIIDQNETDSDKNLDESSGENKELEDSKDTSDTSDNGNESTEINDTTQEGEEIKDTTDGSEDADNVKDTTDTTEDSTKTEESTNSADENGNSDKTIDTTDTTETGDKTTDTDSSSSTNKGSDTIAALPEGDCDSGDITDLNDNTSNMTDSMSGDDSSVSNSDVDTENSTHMGATDSTSQGNVDTEQVELSEKSQRFIEEYERQTGEKVDTSKWSSVDVHKINRALDYIDKASDALDFVDVITMGLEASALLKEGKVDEAGKVLRDRGFSLLFSTGATALLGFLAKAASLHPLVAVLMIGVAGFVMSEVGEVFSDVIDEIFGLYDVAGAYTYPVDPLILDLDGDGVETVSVEAGVNFDFDSNGFAEKLGWVGEDDGLLVRDLNGNGQIDNGGELFGDLTVLDDSVAMNGFEALKYYDTNGDNVINSMDAIYSQLRVWQDANQNGQVDEGEFFSLQDLDITAFNLGYQEFIHVDENGNSHTQKSTYVKSDGTTAILEDVWFAKDAADTTVVDSMTEDTYLEETEAIQALPDIAGRGNQYSLHQAMLRDETGMLQQMIETYVAETDSATRKAMITDIIYVWTGVQDESSTARGQFISDSRKLEALEVITGRDFESVYGTNPVRGAGQYLDMAFNRLVDLYYAELERQTTFAELYSYLYANLDVDELGNIYFDTKELATVLLGEYENDRISGKAQAVQLVANLQTTGFIHMIKEDVFRVQLESISPDIVREAEYMDGTRMNGTYFDDFLNGEMGDDTLTGSKGKDTYYFELGDGTDTISDGEGNSYIVFGKGILSKDIEITRDARNLYLTNSTSGDCIIVQHFFYTENNYVETVRFADGTVWDADFLQNQARYYYGDDENNSITAYSQNSEIGLEDDYMYGGNGDDTLRGNNGNDHIYGESGNDTLQAGIGDDFLEGGTETDTLQGGMGDDTYAFELGDGTDTITDDSGIDSIVFGEGILAKNIEITRDARNLYLTNSTSGDCIIVQHFFYTENNYVETVRFVDGTVWDVNFLQEQARYYYGDDENNSIIAYSQNGEIGLEDDYMYGGNGDDTLRGNSGNDYLYGESGNDTLQAGIGDDFLEGGTGTDTLQGGTGNDTYVFALGDGTDTIADNNGIDCILFGAGVVKEDMEVTRSGNNLCLKNIVTGDCITIQNFFSQMINHVEMVKFEDGTFWNTEDLYNQAGKTFSNEDNNIYSFNMGDGELSINDGNGIDHLVFGTEIQSTDIIVSRDTTNLYFANKTNQDLIKINGFFSSSNYHLETVEFADGTVWNVDTLIDKARYYHGTDESETIRSYDDTYEIGMEDDYIYGYAGNDALYGNAGSDEISGGSGNDSLYGNTGNDILSGDEGDDVLYGNAGNDTFVFNLGDGSDNIYETSGIDRLVLGEGILTEDIVVTRVKNSLYLTNQTNGDQITINNFFTNTNNHVETIEFTDGTVWNVDTLIDKARYYYGTDASETINSYNDTYGISSKNDYIYGYAGNDALYGNAGSDEISGGSGNDSLYGNTGNDILSGDEGDDVLYGNAGNDTFVFNLGDGSDNIYETSGIDRLVFGEGILAEDIVVTRGTYSLYLTNQTNGDRITLNNFFTSTNNHVETIEFADGTVWEVSVLIDKARYYYGTDGADTVKAYDNVYGIGMQDDYIYGGAGDDVLDGGSGDDTYIFGDHDENKYCYDASGREEDIIRDASGTTHIILGRNTTEVHVFEDANNIYLRSGQHEITISNFDSEREYIVEFADGTTWDTETILDNAMPKLSLESASIESPTTSSASTLQNVNVMIQAMASFEDTSGMMWEDAIQQKNEQASDVVNQWWTKE